MMRFLLLFCVVMLASYQLPLGYIKGTTGAGDAFCAGALLGIYKGEADEEILKKIIEVYL